MCQFNKKGVPKEVAPSARLRLDAETQMSSHLTMRIRQAKTPHAVIARPCLQRGHEHLRHRLAQRGLAGGPSFRCEPLHGLIGLARQAGEDGGQVGCWRRSRAGGSGR
jgi:hypothetical protein